jgi:hypothetical protein
VLHKHAFLAALHERLLPRTYFEIGVRRGKSLNLSRCPSVAVDPYFLVQEEVHCDLHLVRMTSDEFFARQHPFAHLPHPVVDFAFIDGMHLAEYAMRDFINTERHCHAASVIVIDDVLPRTVEEAGRARVGKAEQGAWAGDVFKMIPVLRERRPDLLVFEVDTRPTGTLVVMLPDRDDRSLVTTYDEVLSDLVAPDPQVLPDWVTDRSRAIAPEVLLNASFWPELRALRDRAGAVPRKRVNELLSAADLATAKVAS